MNVKMQTSIALLAVSLLCFSAAETENPEKKEEKEADINLWPCKEQGSPNDNVQVFVILRQLEERLRETEKQLQVKLSDAQKQLEVKLSDAQKQLEDLKKGMKDDRVAFGAALGYKNTIGPFKTEITLAYNKVFFNTGAYKPSTGIFTAPVRGVYYFSVTGHSHTSRTMVLRLMKNGVQMVTVYNHPAAALNRQETVTNGMTLQLEVGDQVYVRLLANTWVFDNVNSHSTFIGHLLFRL